MSKTIWSSLKYNLGKRYNEILLCDKFKLKNLNAGSFI